MSGPRAGFTWAPSTSRPLLTTGVRSGANLLTPVTSLFSHVPTATAAPVTATSGKGWLRLPFRHCRHYGDPVFAPTGPRRFGSPVEAPHAASCGSVVVARRCRPLTPERPRGPGTPPRIPCAHASGGLPPRSAAQRMAPSVTVDGLRRQIPDLPGDEGSGASATRPVAVRRVTAKSCHGPGRRS